LATPGGSPPDLDHPTVLIGPEGGWSPEEESRGLAEVGLGPGILRAETAAVAAGLLLASLRAGIVHGGPG
jgi:RsmE family RNA methyltransferase